MLKSQQLHDLYQEAENCKDPNRLEQLINEMKDFKVRKERKIFPYQNVKMEEGEYSNSNDDPVTSITR